MLELIASALEHFKELLTSSGNNVWNLPEELMIKFLLHLDIIDPVKKFDTFNDIIRGIYESNRGEVAARGGNAR